MAWSKSLGLDVANELFAPAVIQEEILDGKVHSYYAIYNGVEYKAATLKSLCKKLWEHNRIK